MALNLETIKQKIEPVAAAYGLPAIYLFGSYATGKASESSDVDLLVDTSKTSLNTLFGLGALYADLEDALGLPIDLVTLDSVEQPARSSFEQDFKNRVLAERIPVYGVM